MKWLLIIFIGIQFQLNGQDALFSVEVSRDTVLLGNVTKVKFTLENCKGDFEPPNFDDFDIVGGPNVSSSVSIINGEMTKSESYSYILKPRDLGQYMIGEVFISADEGDLKTEPVEIIVLHNPEGIIQKDNDYKRMDQFFLPDANNTKKKKYKSKRYKI